MNVLTLKGYFGKSAKAIEPENSMAACIASEVFNLCRAVLVAIDNLKQLCTWKTVWVVEDFLGNNTEAEFRI